ncbi:MAG: glycosyltransferase family 2 protein [Prevotella sp.]|nr:glycosyltransferase family 2 protein [Prevotella sp.]
MKITAVVVTYNRKELLKKVILSLKEIPMLTSIVVVNNGSTDGTEQWLTEQTGIETITQANVGGSGGFYTGIKYAYEQGADWIWCMDDDVFPEPTCLSQLLKQAEDPSVGILCPRRIQAGEIFVNECQEIDTTHTFSSMHQKRLTPEVNEPLDIEGMVFEGPLIRRKVVESIGFPNKDLFIFYDDTDYSLRAVKAGFRVVYVPDAIMQKEKFFSNDTWTEKQQKKKWKRRYQVRNSAYFNHHYGTTFGVRYIRTLTSLAGYLATALWLTISRKGYGWKDIGNLWAAYKDGINERLGCY